MHNHTDLLARAHIATPCPTSWEQMTGDDRVRFCDLCRLQVYNISSLTRTEAETLLATAEGRICARVYRRADGTIITKDCPVGLRALRRRVTKIAGAVFATIMSLCASVAGQKPAGKDASANKQTRISRTVTGSAAGTAIRGTFVDALGAAIADARVTITNSKTKETRVSHTGANGSFEIIGVAPGKYDLAIEGPGFVPLRLAGVMLAAKESIEIKSSLEVQALTGDMIILPPTPPLIDISKPGTTIISGDLIRRLPMQ